MSRIVIIGNGAGGKSTLARTLAKRLALPLIEIDRLLWRPGWTLTPADEYAREHDGLIASEHWIIEGLGSQDSSPPDRARNRDHPHRPSAVAGSMTPVRWLIPLPGPEGAALRRDLNALPSLSSALGPGFELDAGASRARPAAGSCPFV